MPRTELIKGGRAIYRSEKAKAYRCPHCRTWIFTQYEGEADATVVECSGPLGDHLVQWDEED